MYVKIIWIFAISLIFGAQAFADKAPVYKSKYVGQEKRHIKSLSADDIDQLKNGKGWGMAKAAELNGMPGPIHLIEMKEEIHLTENQIAQINDLFAIMKKEAIPQGLKLIELEGKLNKAFEERTIDDEKLNHLLDDISSVYKQLRYVHLSAHLKTPRILSSEQIKQYNSLRGYSSGDPCSNIPKGHDASMWKKHNGCE